MAVYTQLTNEQISELLDAQYAVGALAFAVGITQGVENSNYLIGVHDASGAEHKYILTLYEKRMNPAELPFFLNLMQHLATRGIACPQPIARKDGTLFGDIAGRKAALVSFLQGKSRTVLGNAHVASVGETLGKLHQAAADFAGTRPNALSLPGWQTLYNKVKGQLDGIQPGLEKLIADELDYLTKHWPTEIHPTGVIHADLFPDNVFFEGDKVSGVIDFYFACSDALAYDVAITLNAWVFEPKFEFNPIKSKLLLTHYQKIRSFSKSEAANFSTLLRGAALRFLLTRAYDWLNHSADAQVIPKNPLEYAAKLRFHQQVKSVSEYGL
jgi:homoserine kinase type II